MHVEASEVARGGVQGEASVWGGEHVASEHSMCAQCALIVRCAHPRAWLVGRPTRFTHLVSSASGPSLCRSLCLPRRVFACLLAQVGLGACVCDLN